MMRKFSLSSFMIPLCAGAAMALVGCGPSAGGDDDSPAESPAPSPTPTAPPFDDWFRVSEMLVGDSSEGVDVDADGSVDNNIETILDTIATTIGDAVEEAVCGETACTGQQKIIIDQVNAIISAVLSVESLSNAVNAPIQNGTINYLLEFDEQTIGGDVNLAWNTGEFKNTGYVVKQKIGTQNGKLDDSGSGLFGPGDLTLTFSFENPQSGEPLFSFDITLRSGYTDISGYNATKLDPIYTGGAISQADLIEFVTAFLTQINEVIEKAGGEPIVVDDVIAQVETALEGKSDVDLNGASEGGEAFSVGLVAKAETALIVQ